MVLLFWCVDFFKTWVSTTQLSIFPREDVPESPRAPSENLKASVSMLDVKVQQNERRLNQYGCLFIYLTFI